MKRWPTKPLEQIADLFGGSTPSRANPEFWGGDIHWVTPTDLPMPDEGISIVSKTKDRITQSGLDNSSATVVPKGTVLFSSRATIGKVAVADMPLTTNQGFANFVPHPEVTSRFLAYALWIHREDIARLSGSTTFKEVSRTTLRKFHLPVPPLAEQERIVKLLDEADELRNLRTQADRRTAQLIPALFHEIFGDPETNSLGWPSATFGEVIVSTKLGLVRGAKETDDSLPFPYVRMDAILGDGNLALAPIKRVNANADEVAEFSLRVGDFLFNTRNSRELVGKTALFESGGAYLFNNNIMRIRFNGSIEPRFMIALFQTDFIQRQLEARKSGTTSVVAIYFKNLSNLKVIVPPLALQKEFAQRVTEIRELEAGQATSRTRLDALFQSLLHRAFNGEL
jgi:type I restriction enzyme S subunit